MSGEREKLAPAALGEESDRHRGQIMGAPGRTSWIDCTCGWEGGPITKADGGTDGGVERWKQHRADALLPLVRELQAEAAADALEQAAEGIDDEDGPVAADASDWLRVRAAALRATPMTPPDRMSPT